MDEFPIKTIPSEPHWSENFALAGYDPASGVDLFLHIGRWRKDLNLWREIVTIALPDGSCIAHRAIGNARESVAGPGGPCFAVGIVDPAHRMQWSFLGGARRVPVRDLRRAILQDGPLERVEFNLSYESDHGIWDLSAAGHRSEFMGRGHVEQIGRARGEIKIGGSSFAFDSLVNRDHSRGVRVLDSNRRHIWMHGVFDSGIAFQLYEADIVGKPQPGYSEAAVTVNKQVYPGRLRLDYRLPFEENWDCIEREFSFSIEFPLGTIEARLIKYPTVIYYHSTSPNDLYVGVRQLGSEQSCSYIEQSAVFVMNDGTAGYGHVERLVPGKLIVDPP